MRRSDIFQRTELALVLLLTAGGAQAQCPALGTTYHLASDPAGAQASLTFRSAAETSAYSDLDLVLSVATPAISFTFSPTQSQGYGTLFASARDPVLAETEIPLDLFEVGPDGRLLPYVDTLPQATSTAPAAMFLGGLGQQLWYANTGLDTRINLPSGLWYRAACGS